MKYHNTHFVPSLLSFMSIFAILSPLPLNGQDTLLRQARHIWTMPKIGRPIISVGPNTGVDNCQLEWFGPQELLATLEMPFQRAGDRSTWMGPNRALISGWRLNDTGVICLVSFDPTSVEIQILETMELPGLDPINIASSGNRLFILDRRGRQVLTAPWDESAASPSLPIPSAFEQAHTFVDDPSDRTLHALFESSGEGDRVLDACRMGFQNSEVPFLQISPGAQGGWAVFDPNGAPDVPYEGPYHMSNSAAISSDGPIRLWGKIGRFEVRNLHTNLSVASGVVTNSEEIIFATPTNEMAIGVPHAVMGLAGEGRSNIFYPSVRYGLPGWFPTGGFRPGFIPKGRFLVPPHSGGGSHPGITVSTHIFLGVDELTTAPVGYPVLVWWNWRDDATGVDPVIPVGLGYQLIGAVGSRIISLTLTEDSLGRMASVIIPMGTTSQIGRVLLIQWGTLTPDTNQLVLSDVYGSEIMASSEEISGNSILALKSLELTASDLQILDFGISSPEHDILRAKIEASAKSALEKK